MDGRVAGNSVGIDIDGVEGPIVTYYSIYIGVRKR
jgi:hypothetical protein